MTRFALFGAGFIDQIHGRNIAANIPILIGFSRRFDSNHLGVREAVQAGQIGKIELMHLTSRGPQPSPISYAKVSGGQFRDQTIHFFDLACWIADEREA